MRRYATNMIKNFSSIPDVYSQLKGFSAKGLHEDAINLFFRQIHPFFMNHESTAFIFPSIIKACVQSQIKKPLGHQLHCLALKNGFLSESTVCNSFISMYSKFSDPSNARYLFDTMPQRDTVSWNAMVNCYLQNGIFMESMRVCKEMYGCGVVPKPELIAGVLSGCVQIGSFGFGKGIHALSVVDERFDDSVFLSTGLVDFYWRARDKKAAFRVFDSMADRNEVSWTAMITGCVADHDYEKALDCFRGMLVENVQPNRVTIIGILPVCAELSLVKCGKEILGYSIRNGFDGDMKLSSAIIDMFCRCKEFKAAKLIFSRWKRKDTVMWSCIIAGFAQSTDTAKAALKYFSEMRMDGVSPNNVTLLSMISACTNLPLIIGYARGVHAYIMKCFPIAELNLQNSLITMYAKCGFLHDAVLVFKEMAVRDSVSWTAIIGAYGLHGYGEDALGLFYDMREKGMKVDAVTLLEVITACNHSGLTEEGHRLFIEAMKENEIELGKEHYACYIDLLGREGKVEEACDVVSQMPMKPSARVWSSLVSACEVHGRLEVAERLAKRMIESDPENAANSTLLSMICAKSGDWDGVRAIRKGMRVRKLRKNHGFSRV